MRRLQPVELFGLDMVVPPYRDLKHLLRIGVEVTETELMSPVWIGVPPFEDGNYRPPRGPYKLKVILMTPGRGYPTPPRNTMLGIQRRPTSGNQSNHESPADRSKSCHVTPLPFAHPPAYSSRLPLAVSGSQTSTRGSPTGLVSCSCANWILLFRISSYCS